MLNDDLPESPSEQAVMLENLLIERATGGIDASNTAYARLRREFMQRPDTLELLPSFVRTCRSLDAFWPFIKDKYGTYAERRGFISTEFTPLVDYLEQRNASPADESVSDALATFDEAGVHEKWVKALSRRQEDPEGAITMARTLLETVCKTILDKAEQPYTDNQDLPKLYHMTARVLRLAPSQHQEETFKAILGGCQSVVNGLGTMRNKLGDSHGQGVRAVKPSARHASLAVNLAGTMATFLVETWHHRNK